MDRDENNIGDQVYFVKCNGKCFSRFGTGSNGHLVPLLKDEPDADGMVVPMFRSIHEAKEVCRICANRKYVNSPGGSDGHDVWEIVVFNREIIDDYCDDGSVGCHTEFVEIGTVWSSEV